MTEERLLPIEIPFVDYEVDTMHQVAFVGVFMPTAPAADVVAERIERTLEWGPRLRQRIAETPRRMMLPYWEYDPDFDLADHFRHHTLAPGSTKDDLFEYISSIHMLPFGEGRPLWEAVFVDNIEGGAFLGLRANHCMADATTSMDFIRIASDQRPDYDARMAEVRASHAAAAAERRRRDPEIESKPLMKRMGEFAKSAAGLFTERDRPAFPGPISPERLLTGAVIPLSGIREIRKATGTSPNAVLQTIVSMAMEALHPDLPDEMAVSMPMTVRMLYPMTYPLELNSRQLSTPCAIPMHIDDPLERLHECNRRISTIKVNRKSFLRLAEIASYVPRPLLLRATKRKVSSSNMIVSSVPGPKERFTIDGHAMEEMYMYTGLVPHNPLCFGAAVYADTFTIAITADPVNVPRAAELPEQLDAAYEKLHALTTQV